MARVAIVGAGAIGGALAGLLTAAGPHELLLCTRRPLPMLTVHMPDGDLRVRARNLTDRAAAEPVEWVIVATKTYDAAGAAAWFPALCAEGAPVAIVQNGVEHRERFRPYLSADRLLPVVIDCPVERRGDADVLVRGSALMKAEDTTLGRAFADLFAGTEPRRYSSTISLPRPGGSSLSTPLARSMQSPAGHPAFFGKKRWAASRGRWWRSALLWAGWRAHISRTVCLNRCFGCTGRSRPTPSTRCLRTGSPAGPWKRRPVTEPSCAKAKSTAFPLRPIAWRWRCSKRLGAEHLERAG